MKHCPKSVVYRIVKIEDVKEIKKNDSRTKHKQKSRS